jgi:hypothetical protein
MLLARFITDRNDSAMQSHNSKRLLSLRLTILQLTATWERSIKT